VNIFEAGQRNHDLWAVYGENHWEITDPLALMTNVRVDRDPLTPLNFSSLGSLIYTPVNEHSFHLSAGQSFRNPEHLAQYIDTFVTVPNSGASIPNPPFTALTNHLEGYRDLLAERLLEEEIAYSGRFGGIKARLTGFHSLLKNVIGSGTPTVTVLIPPTAQVQTRFINGGNVETWGSEASLEYLVSSHVSTFANYSLQDLTGDSATSRDLAKQSPRHKSNVGARFKRAGFTSSLTLNWVDKTYWPNYNPANPSVPAYFLLNAHVGYAFKNRLQGLELGVSVYNLANNRHYEVGAPTNSTASGQRGELLGNRWTGTLSYRF
jgi:outer membrane receptor for ferrienterochelin and colicin